MFEDLTKYNKILVTGAPRSGTHICARMVSQDTGYSFLSDRKFSTHNIKSFRKLYANRSAFVTPCPSSSIRRHLAEFAKEDTLIIYMLRNPYEILKSITRIKHSLSRVPVDEAIERIRQSVLNWEKQKIEITHWLEVQYHSLESHPLWIPKEDRINFKPLQTTLRHKKGK